jgi:regulator of protease activity HflC (stomatin/prohibitin superfamily)
MMSGIAYWAVIIVAVLAAFVALRMLFSLLNDLILTVIIFDFQRGLLYRTGRFERILGPGRYTVLRMFDQITVVDMRETLLAVVNQEIVCADNLALRFSASASYKVIDPVQCTHQSQSYVAELYSEAQMVLREIVAGMKIEEVLTKRNELSSKFVELMKERAKDLGVEVTAGGIKDITFPGDVKRIFSQVAQAEKAAQASIAKSRSEMASLRALANASRMMENNPNLMALRTLQSVSELAATSGNTIVLGLPPNMMPVPVNGHKRMPPPPPPAEQGEEEPPSN